MDNMTLIIGILCDQGVVMAADSAATLVSVDGTSTIQQPVHKLRVFDNRVILGVSGPIGLGQFLGYEIQQYCNVNGNKFKKSSTGP